MTLLSGLFSRKNKGSKRDAQVSSVASSVGDDSTLPSPTADYVTPDNHVPSVPNGKSSLHPDSARRLHTHLNGYHQSPSLETMPSTSKLRIFGRKKSSIKPPEVSNGVEVDPSFVASPRPPFLGRTSTSSGLSDNDVVDRRMRPPPSKSAIFAAYTDPTSAQSTRSLPNEGYHVRSASPLPTNSSAPPPNLPTPQQSNKRPSLFAWTKVSSKSVPSKKEKSPAVRPTVDVEPVPDSSFNLKSFRHVGPPTPSQSNSSNVSLHTPQPRPRADTTYSESSQRISVAAFREAQARRSMAGSPSPSVGRSPSPLPTSQSLQPEAIPRTSKPRSPVTPSQAYLAPPQQHRKSGMSFATTSLFTSDTDPDSSIEEVESDDEGTYTPARRGRQAGSRPGFGSKAKSEMGHGAFKASAFRSGAKSHSGHDRSPQPSSQQRPSSQALLGTSESAAEPIPRSQSSLGQYTGTSRPRASASTSALTPSAAAKRASVLAAANAGTEADAINQFKLASRHIRDSSIHSNPPEPPSLKKASTNLGHSNFGAQYAASSDSDSDSDNAPLARFLPPRRPGSAMSSSSNGNLSSRSVGNPPKPLIDIKELTGGSTVANITGSAPTIKPSSPSNPYKSMEGFTRGRTLLSGLGDSNGDPSPSKSPPKSPVSSSVQSTSPQALSNPVTNVPPFKFISPPSTPGQEHKKTLGVPPRSSTMPLPTLSISDLSGKETSSEGERKRDALSERLSKVVKNKVGGSSSLLPTPERSSTAPLPSPSSLSVTPSSQISRDRSQPPESPSRRSVFLTPNEELQPKIPSPTFAPAVQRQRSNTTEMTASTSSATIRPRGVFSKPSPPDPGLADLLGAAGMKLISRNGEASDSESDSDETETSDSESESDGYGYDRVTGRTAQHPKGEVEAQKEEEKIVPIPIKERRPAPSFSVTSRPQLPRGGLAKQQHTLSAVSSTSGSSNAGSVAPSSKPVASPSPQPPLPSSSFTNARKRSSTLTSGPTPPSFASPSPPFATPEASSSRSTPPPQPQNQASDDRTTALRSVGATLAQQPQPRQRSSTLVSTASPQPPIINAPSPNQMPNRPFAIRRDSPASSTGDSSSGRAPLTPRDGSDIVINVSERGGKKPSKDISAAQYSGGASGLGITKANLKKQMNKRRSVSFEENATTLDGSEWRSSRMMSRENLVPATRTSVAGSGKGEGSRNAEIELEERRKERRREEAKAAIELGEVVNGRGPILDDDDDLPMNQVNPRMSAINPMMLSPMPMQPGVGFPANPGWPMGMNPMMPNMGMPVGAPGMLSPAQFMAMLPTPPTANMGDPNFLAAHQQAMMIAKQAYQVAVAQQAMAAAGDEWERSSNIGYGGGSVYGGSTTGGFGMGMGAMMSPNSWSTGSAIMPPSNSARSMFGGGFGSSRSEYGGGASSGRGAGWSSSKSSYGDLGSSSGPGGGGGGRGRHLSAAGGNRDSVYSMANMPPVPPIPGDRGGGSSKSNQRQRTSSQPAFSPSKGGAGPTRRPAPPSSWKNSGF